MGRDASRFVRRRACSLGLEGVAGALAPGTRADLCLVALSGPYLFPAGEDNSVAALLSSARGNMLLTMANGQVVDDVHAGRRGEPAFPTLPTNLDAPHARRGAACADVSGKVTRKTRLARRRKTRRSGGAAATSAAGGATPGSERAAGWTTLLVGLAVTGYLFVANQRYMAFEQYYLLNIALLLWAPLVVILVFLRRPPDDFALTTGDLRPGLLVALVLFVLFLPVIFVTAPTPPFQHYYVNALLRAPQGSGAISAFGRLDVGRLIFHEVVFGFYMFAWEWYFRGFLLYGLKRLVPTVAAVLLQAAAFALLHYNKPVIEVVSSFFGAILLAGVALRYRSFLPCFFLHWAISAAFDGAVLYHFLHAGSPGGFR